MSRGKIGRKLFFLSFFITICGPTGYGGVAGELRALPASQLRHSLLAEPLGVPILASLHGAMLAVERTDVNTHPHHQNIYR